RTTASHGTLIGNLLPFFVLILAHFFIPGDSITLRKTIGILLGFIGIILLFYDDPGIKNEVTTGDIMILGAVVIWSINAIFVKRIISSFHPIQITLYPLMMGVPIFFLEGLIWDQDMIRSIDTTIILSLFYQSIITASFGLVAWNSLLRKHGATVLHSFIFIMPISGVFFGVLLLKEPLTPNLIASILFIAIGLSIINSKFLASNHKNWPK
ncbi:MAG: DMT family transporter, partial [Bacteroidetes bacterium]|nr:DMT family transporter [Bacteroidota bacterium]